ncbi:hypothetical protein MCOR25_009044 [Pyricularia grisea]|uniref:Uncharacterized protein n=1 Tax=Pyricularia grisea TaxID=148305 RepID=A0A6P8BEA4_PYRGI|nr:uncharacterized protein PgNI_04154 [Pyricularia grisea]KAI6353326.1 hypothetical protein MCOR25_009044 [Pyricularia grisea]TLD14153.1 hypothetical protein PgNI_04154 [Pyricularia grisea]
MINLGPCHPSAQSKRGLPSSLQLPSRVACCPGLHLLPSFSSLHLSSPNRKRAMKFFTLLAAAVTVLASPIELERRQSDLVAITDQLLYSTSLSDFIDRRNAQDPPTLDWTSDGCTSSPDNPLGFPFTPACNRHDFGYQNYRIQSRFTQSNKFNIDNNFLLDLNNQCNGLNIIARGTCRALADVYYAAVRAFGGNDATPGRRNEDLEKEYKEKLAIYMVLLAEAKKGNYI